MKSMLLSSVVLVLVISIVKAAPHSSGEAVSEDDAARKVIADAITSLGSLSNENKITPVLLKSIDQECMLKKYKEHSLLNDLTEEAVDFASLSPYSKVDPVLNFANIALSCSNKLDPVLAFIFDNAFSYSGLLDAFREDEPFKEILDELNCFNKYAVENKYLDPEVYPKIHYNLLNQTEEECQETITESKGLISEGLEMVTQMIVTDHGRCLKTELNVAAEKFFLKYVLLVPLGITEDQKRDQRVHFISDAHDILEKILACNAEEDPKTNEVHNFF